jgi:excinuclease ABC subunit B
LAYNLENNITPRQIIKSMSSIIGQTTVADSSARPGKAYIENESVSLAADPVVQYMTSEQIEKSIAQTKKQMEKAAKELDFIEAARLRDEMFALQEMLNLKKQ